MTIFLTTHYIDEAEHADRVALMLDGRMVALAPPRELRETGLAGTLLEVECEPAVEALSCLADVPGVREVTLYGTLLHVLVDDGFDIESLKSVLDSRGVRVLGVREIKPSLEDVFVSRIRSSSSALT